MTDTPGAPVDPCADGRSDIGDARAGWRRARCYGSRDPPAAVRRSAGRSGRESHAGPLIARRIMGR